MRRPLTLALCLTVVLCPGSALAKKKHKKKGLGPVIAVSSVGNDASANPEGVSAATANCPAGTTPVGGGWSAPILGDRILAPFQSYRSGPQTWSVAAGTTPSTSGAVTATAYCRRTPKPVTVASASVTTPAESGAVVSVSATCPTGTHLISGGFRSGIAGPSDFAIPVTSLSSTPGSWGVTAFKNLSSAVQLTADAYCLSGIRAPVVVSLTNAPPLPLAGTASTVSPRCPKAKKPKKGKRKKPVRVLSGGGFSSPQGNPPTPPLGVYTESQIAGGGWRATAVNVTGPTAPLPITSQGICF
jgi:hypothetical protein